MRTRTFHFVILFATATLLLIYQIYVSLSFGFILKPMSADLGMTAETASLISAMFMLTRCLMQLPVGLAVDRFKPGRVLALATLICAAGATLLGLSESVVVAFMSEIAMALGSAFAFVGALKIVGLIVSPARFTVTVAVWQVLYSIVVAALAYFSGMLGLQNDWRGLMLGISTVGVGLAALLWIVDNWLPRTQDQNASTIDWLASLREVLDNREIVLAALIFGLSFGPFLAYSDLWAIPDQLARRNDAAEATAIAGMIPIGAGVGSLLLGILVNRYGRPRMIGATTALIGFFATAGLLFAPALADQVMFCFAFLFGVGASASLIAISHVRVFANPARVGTAVGWVAGVGSLVGALLQTEIGILFEHLHEQRLTSDQFAVALSPLLQCFLLAAVLIAVMKTWPKKGDRSGPIAFKADPNPSSVVANSSVVNVGGEAAITLRVIGDDGHPVAGLEVTLTADPAAQVTIDAPNPATTDANGVTAFRVNRVVART